MLHWEHKSVTDKTPRKRRVSKETRPSPRGLVLNRYFTRPNIDPFDQVQWELRTASITGEGGQVFFEQKDVEVPAGWSQMATNVVVQKYFRGALGTPSRERSVRQLVGRVVDTLTSWGVNQGYFRTDEDAATFRAELAHLLLEQKMSFNSPVWFNVGVEKQPQCSACFINSVEDTMESILTLARTEGMLFKFGSGTGTNFSTLRSSKEQLQGGGMASGPVSFMKGFDAFAGVIKSGGKTRRAAKMVILNIDHPDIVEYIQCKAAEERKAWALIEAGYDSSFTGEAYSSIFFQNSNNSVRVTDEFMEAVQADRLWHTRAVTSGAIVDTYRARDLWRMIAEAAWQCGDPGLQFDTTINSWHTCPNAGRINASNPCSEYMFLDDSACNLASLNLRKFQYPLGHPQAGELDIAALRHAIEITILAQEIIVDNARYPTERIEKNSHAFRPLGLGYANLGALLMSRGLPYDSDAGRAYAAAVTALMGGHAYAMSARIARDVTGPFAGYPANREPFLQVMARHRRHVDLIDAALVPHDLLEAARQSWDEALRIGREHGFRNAQATVLAPTGTISFMMDCDTTGIEPDIALVKYKQLVGGGMLKIVNNTIGEALTRLGYDAAQREAIIEYINEHETIEGAPGLRPEHLPVFDCAFRPQHGTRSIAPMGHVKMMAAVQPFLSGAISKTVNLPNDATVEDIENVYMEAWRLGLKAIAVYRDGCKRSQPLSTSKGNKKAAAVENTQPPDSLPPALQALLQGAQGMSIEQLLQHVAQQVNPKGPPVAVRRKLPDERRSLTHKFSVAGHQGYIHVGMYEDGAPGEIFIRMAKEGSTISGLMDAFATAVSLALQHGVPLRLLIDKFTHTRFEPSGWTGNPEIPRASSIMDYIFRWLQLKFLPEERQGEQLDLALPIPEEAPREVRPEESSPIVLPSPRPAPKPQANGHAPTAWRPETDAPTCHECGTIMVRSGACHKCLNCGATSGCS
ncbi:MAG: vitamin B12-dependent ribonucleotide reductase [Myxococcales bacterium]|nr:vitamin B12-dependent ribonucleotide reductase [Myxococcota bacterium]MDW8280679.1 vitamin B12-dependent ribonucleotide reductase [Myxococcales bacterium]